jgi:hypothetical protein
VEPPVSTMFLYKSYIFLLLPYFADKLGTLLNRINNHLRNRFATEFANLRVKENFGCVVSNSMVYLNYGSIW